MNNFDLDNVYIEKGVPLMEKGPSKNSSKYTSIVNRMIESGPGSSVVVPKEMATSIYQLLKKKGSQVASRKVDKTLRRVWILSV